MPGSFDTTNFFQAEVGSNQSYLTGGKLHVKSGATLETDGDLDIDSRVFKSVDTTASATSLALADGQLSLVSHSANSIVLAYRSGATTYVFTNDAGGVL